MSTDITQLTPPSQERLSVTCRALADELAGLIKRTMKLYAEELAIAEATPLTPRIIF